MTRQKNDQIPLGELLTKARMDKHMSRAQLAKETGFSENSLIRYEKAGLEKDGQYPPGPKLAKLCFTLDISPLTAMFSSLSPVDYWDFKCYTWENWLMGHPDHEYLLEQWFTLVNENHKLTAVLKLMLGPEPEPNSDKEITLDWLKSEARKIIGLQEAFDQRIAKKFNIPKQASFVTPGDPQHGINDGAASPFDYTEFTKNGPDQEDPSRSIKPKNNPKAVSAASTRPKKGQSDEVI